MDNNRNNPINKVLKWVATAMFVIAVVVIAIPKGMVLYNSTKQKESQPEEKHVKKEIIKTAAFDIVKTEIKIGPDERRTVPLDNKWSGWITIDSRVHFSAYIEGGSKNRGKSKFQFLNKTETKWLSPEDNVPIGKTTKTFRARLERGTAELFIITSSVQGSRTKLTIPH